LVVELQVVILKMNPVNAYLGPLLEAGFQALVQRGVLRIVYGGAAERAYLCQHPAVDTIHMTGSDRTFEAIVFGPERTPLSHERERGVCKAT
jgi:acyl-CoA reductase-like NAD-dependent aldehyde dehydrogenase